MVTTNAPAVLSSVRSESLVVLKDHGLGEVNAEVYGSDLNSILKHVMGVRERYPAVRNSLRSIMNCWMTESMMKQRGSYRRSRN